MVKCRECIFECELGEGGFGRCGIFKSLNGTVKNLHEGRGLFASVHPVEAVPFYHYYPGGRVFILWTIGCPPRCEYCPLKAVSGDYKSSTLRILEEDKLVDLAERQKAKILMVNGGETFIHASWLGNILREGKGKNLSTAMKTLGLGALGSYEKLSNLVDAVILEHIPPIVDVGGFRDKLLESYETIVRIYKHLEVIIPYVRRRNTKQLIDLELLQVIASRSLETPIHIIPYVEVEVNELYNLRRLLIGSIGFKHVYVPRDPLYKYLHTTCPKCNKIVIERDHAGMISSLLKDGKCPYCNFNLKIYGEPSSVGWKISKLKLEEIVW